jgi:outer membrane protein
MSISLKRQFFAGTIAVLSAMIATTASAETLREALISAYKNSGILQQQRAVLRAADEDVASAVATLRPVLSYAANSQYSSITDSTTNSLRLSAGWELFTFGNRKLDIALQKELVLSARDQLVSVEQSVLSRAVNAYMNVRDAIAFVNLRDSNVRLISQELRAANDRFEVGEVTRTDVSLAEARLAAARANFATAQGDLAVAREEYRAAIGHLPKSLSPPPQVPSVPKSAAAARDIARDTHPDLKAAQRAVTVRELALTRAKGAMKPTLSLDVARTFSNSDSSDGSSVGLTLSGPIYSGGAIASSVRKTVAERDSARYALIVAGQNVDQAVANAWAQRTVALANLDATQRQVRASRVAFQGVQEEASLGARTTLDVLDAEQELLDAQVSAISAATGRYLASYDLLATMGLLTADYLKLGIATYDPAAYYNTVSKAPLTLVSPEGERLDRVLKSLGKF